MDAYTIYRAYTDTAHRLFRASLKIWLVLTEEAMKDAMRR